MEELLGSQGDRSARRLLWGRVSVADSKQAKKEANWQRMLAFPDAVILSSVVTRRK